MTIEMERTSRARALAQWFRTMAPDADGLMARTADALEEVAEDETADPVPEVAPVQVTVRAYHRPVAMNDNARRVRRRTRH